MLGTQDFVADGRNDGVLVYVNGALVPRAEATVSVFDAGFVLGDGLWEGIRLHRGKLAFLDAHIERLYSGAKAIDLDIGLSRAELVDAVWGVLRANGMSDGVHIRLMVTRGRKRTPNQDPRHCLGAATIVIVAEYKVPPPSRDKGARLFTSTIRSSPPDIFDMRLNSHSRLNFITALLQAIKAGGDEALMLDPNGFIASCNSTNFFFVKNGAVFTSSGEYCFNGITRGNVMALCRENGIELVVGNHALGQAYAADEAFVTGTMGGIAPVCSIDGRMLGPAELPGPVTMRLRKLYQDLLDGC
ncbi:MAG: aminotransferase class IV [Rhizobiales bacterium]|nr:aminotransferase class IV [Hyphomicrobiales bacterium]